MTSKLVTIAVMASALIGACNKTTPRSDEAAVEPGQTFVFGIDGMRRVNGPL